MSTLPSVLARSDSPNRHIVAVDGLRGIAVLLVFLLHFVALQLPREIASWQAYLSVSLGLSFSGVDLFFVISGFLISGILMDNREAPNFYPVFYLRRVLRIIPLYYGFILVCWLAGRFAPDITPQTYPVGAYLGFLSNFWMAANNAWELGWLAVAWTLAVEEQFYLIFPLLIKVCSPARFVPMAMAAIVLAPVLRVSVLLFAPSWSLSTHVLAPCRMDSLAFGVLAAIAMRHERMHGWLIKHPRAPALLALATLPVLAYLTLSRAEPQMLPMAAFGYTAIGMFYMAVLLALLLRQPIWLAQICETRILVFIGGISYFIYLFQWMAGSLIFRAFGRPHVQLASLQDAGLTVLTLAALAVAGAVSLKFFESRLIALGSRFRYPVLPKESVPPAVFSETG